MRIAYLAAGAAGMYCGSCLHDNTLAAAMLARGEDAILVPTYTPMRTDEVNVSQRRVFLGGVNAYLQQASALFRKTPRWLSRILDNSTFLGLVTSGAGSVNPAKLGALTVSMLRGEEGNQSRSIDELVDWLIHEARPDVVHLSNSMLLGLARPIAKRGGPPMVCSLSGEDLFLEGLSSPYYDEARLLLSEQAGDVEAFTAMNAYYADFMADYLSLERSKVHVVPHGLNLEGIEPREAEPVVDEPVIGYLARICPAKGLHLLVEACELLAERRPEAPPRLRAAGYLSSGEREYLINLHRRVDQGPLEGRFDYLGELDRKDKYDFLRSLTLFSTPTVHTEAKGLPALEAMAVGVPVVLPEHGSFPEMIEATGGGVLCEPGDSLSLADKLEALLDNAEQRCRLGASAARGIREHYRADQMAEQMLGLYRNLVDSPSR